MSGYFFPGKDVSSEEGGTREQQQSYQLWAPLKCPGAVCWKHFLNKVSVLYNDNQEQNMIPCFQIWKRDPVELGVSPKNTQ